MERAQRRRLATVVPAGDAALLIRLGSRPGPTATRRVLALVAALDGVNLPGLLDVVPAYTSVLLRFDPLTIEPAALATLARAALEHVGDAKLPRGRTVHIPVRYGGADGPDFEDVANVLGLTRQELIQRHASASYRVAFLGFLAGFPYLTGLPSQLAVSRLATPRTRVSAGSVAVAERQAGIYPVASPGGWRILGRTSVQLFDPTREPPSLLRPGDHVRFVPAEYAPESDQPPRAVAEPRQATETPGIPWLRVLRAGWQTTVQDRGRTGYARYGVSASGAADPDALAIGNALLANAPDAAALEVAGGDADFEVSAPCVVAVTGAPCRVRINERLVTRDVTFALAPGDVLSVAAPAAGMRAYLCVAGGVSVPAVMGSRATDLRAEFGGLRGRPLRDGDVLARGREGDEVAGRALTGGLLAQIPANGDWRLRILPGPHARGNEGVPEALLRASFTVDARSDRVGVRLRRAAGPCLDGGQVLSEGVPRGAVQLPPDGEPVLLLADAQATGGYRVPAVVISADLWRIGQLRPGALVSFHVVSPEEALAALRRRANVIERVRRQPSPRRMMEGFAELSDDIER